MGMQGLSEVTVQTVTESQGVWLALLYLKSSYFKKSVYLHSSYVYTSHIATSYWLSLCSYNYVHMYVCVIILSLRVLP